MNKGVTKACSSVLMVDKFQTNVSRKCSRVECKDCYELSITNLIFLITFSYMKASFSVVLFITTRLHFPIKIIIFVVKNG